MKRPVFEYCLLGALFVTVVFLPFNLIVVQTCLAFAAVTLIFGRIKGLWRWEKTPLDLPLAFFILVMVGSLFVARQPVHSLFSSTAFWVFLAYYVFSQALRLVGGPGRLKKAFYAVLVFSSLAGVFAILQHFFGFEVPFTGQHVGKAPFAPDTYVSIGHFQRHTTLAFVLSISVLVGLGLIASEGKTGRRVLLSLLLFPVLVAIFFTYVRMAYLGLFLAILAVGFIYNRKVGLAALAAMAVAASIASLTSDGVRTKMEMMFSREGDNGRSYIWRRTMEMTRDNPAAGIGHGNFTPVAKAYYERVPDNMNLPRCHAHNIYLHYWCETGPLGLFAFLYLLVSFFLAAVPIARGGAAPPGSGVNRYFAAVSIGVVVLVASGSAAQDVLFDGQVAFFTIFLMAAGLQAGDAMKRMDAAPSSGKTAVG